MRKTGIAAAVFATAVFAAGCDRGSDGKPTGPMDPIPGPAGAVSPAGNTVPQGGTTAASAASATPEAAAGTSSGSASSAGAKGGTAAESKMPPQGSGNGKSVQEASAHGATKTTEEKKK